MMSLFEEDYYSCFSMIIKNALTFSINTLVCIVSKASSVFFSFIGTNIRTWLIHFFQPFSTFCWCCLIFLAKRKFIMPVQAVKNCIVFFSLLYLLSIVWSSFWSTESVCIITSTIFNEQGCFVAYLNESNKLPTVCLESF